LLPGAPRGIGQKARHWRQRLAGCARLAFSSVSNLLPGGLNLLPLTQNLLPLTIEGALIGCLPSGSRR
jgi:hypothetical protein